jgi:hypothetical protein
MLLDGLPTTPNLWPTTLYYIVKSYRSKLAYYLTGDKRIPECLPRDVTRHIIEDVRRAVFLFEDFARGIGIEPRYFADAETSIVRFTVIMILEAPQYEYLQGYDRFSVVSYALGLGLAVKLGLSQIEGEAFAGVLLRRLVPLSYAHRYLASQAKMQEYFADVDSFLRVFNADIMRVLGDTGDGSVSFASNWAGLLFMDGKPPASVLLIWDQFVVHHEDVTTYFKAMASAHLFQVEKGTTGYEQLNAIQQFTAWDVPRLIADAERVYGQTSWGQPYEPRYIMKLLTAMFF